MIRCAAGVRRAGRVRPIVQRIARSRSRVRAEPDGGEAVLVEVVPGVRRADHVEVEVRPNSCSLGLPTDRRRTRPSPMSPNSSAPQKPNRIVACGLRLPAATDSARARSVATPEPLSFNPGPSRTESRWPPSITTRARRARHLGDHVVDRRSRDISTGTLRCTSARLCGRDQRTSPGSWPTTIDGIVRPSGFTSVGWRIWFSPAPVHRDQRRPRRPPGQGGSARGGGTGRRRRGDVAGGELRPVGLLQPFAADWLTIRR